MHAPVHSDCFIMDKTFCHMQHDDVSRKDLFQVMEAFSKVIDADGQMADGQMVSYFFPKKMDYFFPKKMDFLFFSQKNGLIKLLL